MLTDAEDAGEEEDAAAPAQPADKDKAKGKAKGKAPPKPKAAAAASTPSANTSTPASSSAMPTAAAAAAAALRAWKPEVNIVCDLYATILFVRMGGHFLGLLVCFRQVLKEALKGAHLTDWCESDTDTAARLWLLMRVGAAATCERSILSRPSDWEI